MVSGVLSSDSASAVVFICETRNTKVGTVRKEVRKRKKRIAKRILTLLRLHLRSCSLYFAFDFLSL